MGVLLRAQHTRTPTKVSEMTTKWGWWRWWWWWGWEDDRVGLVCEMNYLFLVLFFSVKCCIFMYLRTYLNGLCSSILLLLWEVWFGKYRAEESGRGWDGTQLFQVWNMRIRNSIRTEETRIWNFGEKVSKCIGSLHTFCIASNQRWASASSAPAFFTLGWVSSDEFYFSREKWTGLEIKMNEFISALL